MLVGYMSDEDIVLFANLKNSCTMSLLKNLQNYVLRSGNVSHLNLKLLLLIVARVL
jgi:hypothetical protein